MKFFGDKLNGVNCRSLMKHHNNIIDDIRDIFITMNKDIVSNEGIRLVNKK